MTKYDVVSKFHGYRNKTDRTNMPPGTLVVGSSNVLLNDGERVASRQGYTLDGDASVELTPILSAYDWTRHLGDTAHLRSYFDQLQYRYVDSEGTVTWRTLQGGWDEAASFNYAEFWNTTELIDVLLMVNGSSNIYEWSGAVTTYASSTMDTITKEGDETWAEIGAFTDGTRGVIINGDTYTYTGGEDTLTLTGVSPDPTGAGIVAGDVVHQALRTNANADGDLPAEFQNDLIASLYNQVYVGSFLNRSVYVSAVDSFTDFTFSSPRMVGEGALLTLDGTPVGLIPQEDSMYVTAGKEFWYQTTFILSSDQAAEALEIVRLKTAGQAAAQSQALISKMKNYVFFVSNEPTLDTLGKLELINTPQTSNISDPIKIDFDSYDFSGGSCFYWRNYLFVAVPADGIVLMFNVARALEATGSTNAVSIDAQSAIVGWEAPQLLPISRFSIIDGQLYGHSSQVPETYRMFDGYNDNGNPIAAVAAFSYQNGGDRANTKNFNQFYSEGYMTANTSISLDVGYNYQACGGTASATIDGTDPVAVCSSGSDGSLGKASLGVRSLAGRGATTDTTLPPKFRIIKTFPKTDCYEWQAVYSSDAVDQRWELLAFGPNAMMSTSTNANITE